MCIIFTELYPHLINGDRKHTLPNKHIIMDYDNRRDERRRPEPTRDTSDDFNTTSTRDPIGGRGGGRG